jgi:hypothetical protein
LFLVETKDAGPLSVARTRAVAAAARGSLAFLGYQLAAPIGGAADMRLLVAPATSAADDLGLHEFSSEELHYFCLKVHFRSPLLFSREGLAAARTELGSLRASARSLSGVTLEPSSRGVTGYLHRFREALGRDLDFPEALSCVWDGLRPGALSPGSKAALLRAALPALGLEEPAPL